LSVRDAGEVAVGGRLVMRWVVAADAARHRRYDAVVIRPRWRARCGARVLVSC
jgi:hypothetical protein